MSTFDRILVATDFSDASRQAAREALMLAEKLGASVRFVHVVDDRQVAVVPGSLLPLPQAPIPGLAENARARLDGWVRELGDTPVAADSRVVFGAACDGILNEASEWKAGLIVLGTHGRTGLVRAVLGSVAELVVRRSKTPVLVVRAPEAASAGAGGR